MNVQCKKVLWVASWGWVHKQQRNYVFKCELNSIFSSFGFACCIPTKEKLGSALWKDCLPCFLILINSQEPMNMLCEQLNFCSFILKKHSWLVHSHLCRYVLNKDVFLKQRKKSGFQYLFNRSEIEQMVGCCQYLAISSFITGSRFQVTGKRFLLNKAPI